MTRRRLYIEAPTREEQHMTTSNPTTTRWMLTVEAVVLVALATLVLLALR